MFGISVKIVRDMDPPREDIIDPDPEMKHCMVVTEENKSHDMKILFQNGNHFNLVVSNNSDLAIFGNNRKVNHNPKVEFIETYLNHKKQKIGEKKPAESEQEVISLTGNVKDDTKTLKKVINELENHNKIITDNHEAMVVEMKCMREQVEYLKIENHSLKEEKQLREQNLGGESNDLCCSECGFVCFSRNHLRSHMKISYGVEI